MSSSSGQSAVGSGRQTFPTGKIALIGFMGSGKSTVGKQLATALQLPLFDTDSLIETRTGKSIAEIFATEGEAHFRSREYQLLHELLTGNQQAVIVCGGGTPCIFDAMDRLNKYAVTIYLQTPVEILYARLKDTAAQRPLLQGKEDLPKFITDLFAQREKFYRQAHHTIATESKTVEKIVEEIINL
jgi:shikimate kinase